MNQIAAIGTCLKCGYDLRGLGVGACPECGRAFDPGRYTTFRNQGLRRPGRAARLLLRPPGLVWSSLAAIIALHMLWRARIPGDDVVMEGLIALGVCIVRAFIRHLMSQQYPDDAGEFPWTRFCLAPIVLVFALAASRVTFELAMWVSRPDFEELAQTAIVQRNQGKWNTVGACWAGSYHVDSVTAYDEDNYFNPTRGSVEFTCHSIRMTYVIEDVGMHDAPTHHGRSYWRNDVWQHLRCVF